ncbi:MAG: putative toxin-antitoxin system toxin component, PIN family [Pirellulales bacterium]
MAGDPPVRIVLDSNSLVSGFLFPQSIPGQALDLVLRRYLLLMSIEVAAELTEVMRREKFERFLSRQHHEEVVADTIRDSKFVATSTIIKDCRDPNDNKFLELAVDGLASAIVTGDADLLSLHPFQGIAILKPRDFLARFATE